jgi:O-antigen/teichoic acid export membrane protein
MKLNIKLNSAFSLLETLVNGVCLFALYALVNRQLGLSELGVWALVVATGSMTRVADFGIGQALQRKVAVALIGPDPLLAARFVAAGVMLVAAIYAVLLVVAYAPALWAIEASLGKGVTPSLQRLLLISFVSFWISQIAWLFLFALCGAHRVYLKCVVSMTSTVLNLGAAVLLIPGHGIQGVALAQVAQSVLAFVLGIVLLVRVLPRVGPACFRFNRALYRELLSYGWKLQAVAVMVLGFEPVSKFILGRFYGAEAVGVYELATRMVQQIRSVVLAPNNALVPAFAALGEHSSEQCHALLRKAQGFTNSLGNLVMGMTLGLLAAVGEIWTGQPSPAFVTTASILTVAWLLNLYSAPVYYMGMALDQFRGILAGHALIVAVNVALGIAAGWAGVEALSIAAIGSALVSGSMLWMRSIAHLHGMTLSQLIGRDLLRSLLPLGAGGVIVALVHPSVRAQVGPWGTAAVDALLVGLVAVVCVLWDPRLRSYLTRREGRT